MWKSTVTYGVLAFLSATSTLWILDTAMGSRGAGLFAPVEREVDPDGPARIAPRTATAGVQASARASAPKALAAPGGDLSNRRHRPVARPSLPVEQQDATKPGGTGLPMDVDARALLSSAMRDAGFYTSPASTRSAIAHVVRGDADVAIVSRRPSPQQLKAAIGVRSLGRFVPAIVVHPDNPLHDLGLDQVRALLAGRIENWSQIGGPDQAVKLVLPQSEGMRNAFARALVPGDSLAADSAGSDDDFARMRTVRSDPAAITVVPAPATESSELRVITIGGIGPSQRVGYPYGQELFLIYGPRPTTEVGVRATEELYAENESLQRVLSPI